MKKRRARGAAYLGIAASTTCKDWGLGPVPGKGGKTRNAEIPGEGERKKRKK